MTNNQIREELRDIKYYYQRQKSVDEACKKITPNAILSKVDKYNKAIENATTQLYDVYISLYIRCLTQESLAEDLGYSPIYVQRLNKKLVEFFVNNLEKEEN